MISARKANRRKQRRFEEALACGGPQGGTDWACIDTLTDEEIAAAVAADPDAAPIEDEAWFRRARLVPARGKVPVTMRLDQDVLSFFKDAGPGYQTRINRVLRAFLEHGLAARRG